MYVWDEALVEYTQRGLDINGEAADNYSGWSVSLSGDGNVLAVGAPYNDGNGSDSGYVRVYSWDVNQDKYTQRGSGIDGETADDFSGWSVSLSDDGDILAVGAPNNDGNGNDSGHVRVYSCNVAEGEYTQRGSDIDGEAATDFLGRSTSLSGDGNILAVGAILNHGAGPYSGHVRVYSWNVNEDKYTQRGSDINGEDAYNLFGWSVSLSHNGNVLSVGAIGNNEFRGSVRVYDWEL